MTPLPDGVAGGPAGWGRFPGPQSPRLSSRTLALWGAARAVSGRHVPARGTRPMVQTVSASRRPQSCSLRCPWLPGLRLLPRPRCGLVTCFLLSEGPREGRTPRSPFPRRAATQTLCRPSLGAALWPRPAGGLASSGAGAAGLAPGDLAGGQWPVLWEVTAPIGNQRFAYRAHRGLCERALGNQTAYSGPGSLAGGGTPVGTVQRAPATVRNRVSRESSKAPCEA